MVDCKICNSDFRHSPDSIVICDYHQGVVHLGCCIDKCSWNKKPCQHCQGVYEKL